MLNILPQIARDLIIFLDKGLSEITPNYWDSHVLSSLSIHQKRLVEHKNISLLKQLDLAALLTVFDKNYSELCFRLKLPYEGGLWVKEMHLIRNKYAHLSPGGEGSDEDKYREYDTAFRFAQMIKADDLLLDYIKQKQDKSPTSQVIEVTVESNDASFTANTVPISASIELGQIVLLKTDRSVSGVVTKIIPSSPENRYEVFINNQKQTLYESQIEVKPEEDEIKKIRLAEFHANLSALLINNPGMSTLYSLHSARINFVPFQFRPVLKFIHSDRPRLLIADEVGVGKTIEAGLIIRELQARSNINSVLIICPKPLVTEHKWQTEMKRFDEVFTELDGKTLRHCINEYDLEGKWPNQHDRTILPFSLFDEEMIFGGTNGRREVTKPLVSLDPPPKFDLVIVDEAHHLRNASTFLHQGVRYFCENAEAVLFLTATPIQLGQDDLYVLLNLLRPDLIIDRDSFISMAEPNPYLNKAIEVARSVKDGWNEEALKNLHLAQRTSWGKRIFVDHPEFNEQVELLQKTGLTEEDRISFIRDVEELHTFSGIINRTRRRDIGEFTMRKPETVTIDFTEEQRFVHDLVLETQAQILRKFHEDKSINFMMSTIRRQVASCLHGLVPYLRDILSRRINILELDEDGEESTEFQPISEHLSELKEQIEKIIVRAERLPSDDPKLESLVKIVREKQQLSNNKILLFSSFRHTLNYLLLKLSEENIRVALITGDTSEYDRRDLRKKFSESRELPDSIDVLLSSEVGCEGLDYQFCDCLVNYDLPWNPMRIEQRIGRIDRYGQKSESVAIYNFITPGTVEGDIYDRCLLRIGVFQKAIGGSEEILGQISKEIKSIAEDLTLSPSQRQERLQQIADNQIRLIQEQTELEEKQVELFGINLPPKLIMKKIEDANSFWLAPRNLQNMIEVYLSGKSDTEQFFLSDKAVKTLRLNQKTRNLLLEDVNAQVSESKALLRRNQSVQDWIRWLKSDSPMLTVTFEDYVANDDRATTFITPVHPLARQAAINLSSEKVFHANFNVNSDILQSGNYPFAIYEWKKTGIKSDVILKPVCQSEEVSEKLLELLEMGVDSTIQDELSQKDRDDLDKLQYDLWNKEKERHGIFNSRLANFRKQSLLTSSKARINQLEEQITKASEEKIKRMRLSQLKSVKADYERRLAEIEKAEESSDIITKPIAFGIMTINNGE